MPSSFQARTNVADRLSESAHRTPDQVAVAECWGKHRQITLGELDREVELLASGLIALGVRPQMRLALLVKPGIEFVALVFALLKSGATMVLVDAALGRQNIVRCLASTQPEGFVAIPLGQALRIAKRRHFPNARFNVTVGRKWGWSGPSLDDVRRLGESNSLTEWPLTAADDPAAVVFTSGSTGPPKGVEYRHETFVTQLTEIERMYGLESGGIDLACFPLFGLFNVALGITTVFPEMDFSRPAKADPRKLFEAADRWGVTQSFASPAVWNVLSHYCRRSGTTIPTLREVFSCGAPVPPRTIEHTLECVAEGARLHTPYGATESLPVSTIEAAEILGEAAAATGRGEGVCVGRKVDSIDWRVIAITDEPIGSMAETTELPTGRIGELVVRGPQVSRCYLPAPHLNYDANAASKIVDGEDVWHRMGDVGYLDALGRFWYCGRKSQRVTIENGTLFTECVEGIANTHPWVARSALVGVGPRGQQVPVVIVEPVAGADVRTIETEVMSLLKSRGASRGIERLLIHKSLPTDIRHNAKIQREQLAEWAAERLKVR
jgi:acyl-CoA synthetase (AMP-forming)/AMP-acid ligase II